MTSINKYKKSICGKIFLLCFILLGSLAAQQLSPSQIRQKMAKIRQSTNWDNAEAAKKANEEIRKLARQLMLSGKNQNTQKDQQIDKSEEEKNVDYKLGLWKQMMEAASKGEDADILLGKPVREEIIEEYKDDESPNIKSQDYLDEMTLLVIDMSLNTVQRTIDQMDKFKSIKTLVITGGKFGAPVNLDDLLTRAKNYPLQELYIINFKNFVTEIPKQVGKFKNLTLLSIINNQLKMLPSEVGTFIKLNTLYVDINPITTLLPTISKLKQLDTLGIGKTSIAQSEIDQIKQQLPNCKILLQ